MKIYLITIHRTYYYEYIHSYIVVSFINSVTQNFEFLLNSKKNGRKLKNHGLAGRGGQQCHHLWTTPTRETCKSKENIFFYYIPLFFNKTSFLYSTFIRNCRERDMMYIQNHKKYYCLDLRSCINVLNNKNANFSTPLLCFGNHIYTDSYSKIDLNFNQKY